MSACSDPAAVTLQLSGWYESRVHEAKASANVIKAGDEMLGTMSLTGIMEPPMIGVLEPV